MMCSPCAVKVFALLARCCCSSDLLTHGYFRYTRATQASLQYGSIGWQMCMRCSAAHASVLVVWPGVRLSGSSVAAIHYCD